MSNHSSRRDPRKKPGNNSRNQRSGQDRSRSGDQRRSGSDGRGRSRSGGQDRSGHGGQGGGDRDRYKSSGGQQKQRRDLKGAAVDLPHWVIEDLSRITPKERVADALAELGAATSAMIEGRYKVALRSARRAKELAPRDATVRETLGLAAYRTGDWQTALAELRAYRRISGEPTHLPVEMDVLRALGRKPDVDKAWRELKAVGASPAVHKEGLVVYGSFLIDENRAADARRLTTPKNIKPNPYPADLRVWYVAARANAIVGDLSVARKLRDAVTLADPAFPGLDELDALIASAS